MMSSSSLLVLGALLLARGSTAAATSPQQVDTCVVGAGGAGAFASMRLKQLGQRVLVLESLERIGGHCDTFYPPGAEVPGPNFVEKGVVYLVNESIVFNTYKEWNVSLTPFTIEASPNQVIAPTIEFDGTGKYLGFTVPPDPLSYPQFLQALQAFANRSMVWIEMFNQKFPYIETANGANTDFSKLDKATIKMLMQPAGKLLDQLEAEYGSFAPMYSVMEHVAQGGYGPVREVPAYTFLRMFRPTTIEFFLGDGNTATNGCLEIYLKFAAYLGSDLKLNVTKLSIRRHSGSVSVSYVDANKKKQTATCDKLIVAAPNDLANMKSFIADLDGMETSVFKQVTSNTLATGVSKLPPVDIPGALPYLLGFTTNWTLAQEPIFAALYKHPNGYALGNVLYPEPPSQLNIKNTRGHFFETMHHVANASGVFAGVQSVSDVDQDEDDLHTYWPRPKKYSNLPAFFKSLYALQGHKRTYYTGALQSFNLQSDVWRYSEWLISTYFGGPPFP